MPITPTLAQRKSTFTPSEKKNEREVVKTTIVEHSYDFQGTSSRDIYEALLDPKRADIWTRSKSKVSKKIGTDFEFFDGNVHGVLLQAVKYVKYSLFLVESNLCISVYRPQERVLNKLGD